MFLKELFSPNEERKAKRLARKKKTSKDQRPLPPGQRPAMPSGPSYN